MGSLGSSSGGGGGGGKTIKAGGLVYKKGEYQIDTTHGVETVKGYIVDRYQGYGVTTRAGTTRVTDLHTGMLVGQHDGGISEKTTDAIKHFEAIISNMTSKEYAAYERRAEAFQNAKQR